MVISHLLVQYTKTTSFEVSENLCLDLYYQDTVSIVLTTKKKKAVIIGSIRIGLKNIARKLVVLVEKVHNLTSYSLFNL